MTIIAREKQLKKFLPHVISLIGQVDPNFEKLKASENFRKNSDISLSLGMDFAWSHSHILTKQKGEHRRNDVDWATPFYFDDKIYFPFTEIEKDSFTSFINEINTIYTGILNIRESGNIYILEKI